jgi:replication factor C subunit 1
MLFLYQKGKASPKKSWSASSGGSQKSYASSSQSQTDSQPMEISESQESVQSSARESLLWVDKYKPTNVRQIIGQQGDKSNAKKLLTWLQQWRDNYGKKPACKYFE